MSLDLGTIGIPFGVEHRGCKLLFTTRDLDVLLRMESEKNFSIGILNEQEAWRLFKIMAGDYVENRELESTATSVAKACGGLPIALTTVAKALRKKELPVWKNALQELQTPSEASFDEGVPAEAYSTIELSYKYLRGEQLKKTFLLCSLITPAPIMDLFKYSMGLGVFKSVHKLEDAHNKLDAWSLRELKLKFDFMDICSMKLQGINNVECLWLDKLQGIENVLFNLDTEGFSQLKLLWVQNNPDFFCIVDSRAMVACDAFPLLESLILHNLINMERIWIDQLKVESFNELKIIQAYNCDKLSNIFWLSTVVNHSSTVVNCSKMKEIFAIGEEVDNSIEKIELAQLRYLSLGNLPEVTSFCREVKTPSASPNRPASQEESTTTYSSSEITLDTSTLLFNEKVALPNLEALEISAINVDKIWHYNQIPAAVFPRFQNLTRLIVWHCNKLKYIFSASMIGSLKHLQHLEVRFCEDLQEIISENRADEVIPYFVFPQLTTLILQYLPKLRCLYPGMHTSEWPALEIFSVFRCDKLKIFAADLSQNNENDQLGIPAQQPPCRWKRY
ncbi:hypothetical protein CUMW_123390, partial [Citrus unshiu]